MDHYLAAKSEVIAMLAAIGSVVLLGAGVGVVRSLRHLEGWCRPHLWRQTRGEVGQ